MRRVVTVPTLRLHLVTLSFDDALGGVMLAYWGERPVTTTVSTRVVPPPPPPPPVPDSGGCQNRRACLTLCRS